jgi:hypothetical protein
MKRERELTLDDVPDDLLAECGLRRGGASTSAYQCTDPDAVLVALSVLTGPSHRKLNRDDLAKILRGFKDGDAIPPVDVFYDADNATTNLLHGAHRWKASLAFGFTLIPCKAMSREDAEGGFGYLSLRL